MLLFAVASVIMCLQEGKSYLWVYIVLENG